jgi:hypothetical protein
MIVLIVVPPGEARSETADISFERLAYGLGISGSSRDPKVY